MMTLNEQAYDYLKNMIAEEKLEHQKIYSETRLAQELGISRTPFRDAVQRLVQEGYIDIIPSKGFRLHRLTRQDVIETFQVRSALEGYCTMEITRTHTSERARSLFARLHSLTDEMQKILETTKSIEEFSLYDFRFHTEIISYLDNCQLANLYHSYLYRMKKLAGLSLAHEGRMADTCREHLAILNAMEQGDTCHIYEATLTHMTVPRGINLEDL